MDSVIEQEDAQKVKGAVGLINAKRLEEAEAILRDVVCRTPRSYDYEFVRDGKRHIKFWDFTEFIAYLSLHKTEDIVWVASAYPRACYLLGALLNEKGDHHNAIAPLELGCKLEPRNPRLLNELGFAHGKLKNHRKALECYQGALDARGVAVSPTGAMVPELNHDRAVALRGAAVQMIDLGQLEAARQMLIKSLQIEPDSVVAKNELAYIAQIAAKQIGDSPSKGWRKFWK